MIALINSADTAEIFAIIYNDLKKYPTIKDVAKALDRSKKTVKNFAGILRARKLKGENVPELIWRGQPSHSSLFYGMKVVMAEVDEASVELTVADHANNRAKALSTTMTDLFTGTDRPVINPEVLVVKSHITTRYDRHTGAVQEIEGAPRTFITDTLRVGSLTVAQGRRFLFTSAQNDAELDLPFWENLNAYADEIGAEIVVGPLTYETQWWDENNPASRKYDPLLSRYLCFGQFEIGENFVFFGEMNTLPTSSRPISDLAPYSAGKWGVFPHPNLQLISVPSLDPERQAHQIMTTGSVTKPMIIPRKSGIKAIKRHTIGATLVEFGANHDLPFCRQIVADSDGSFYDLDAYVAGGHVTFGHRVVVLNAPDIHVAKLDPKSSAAIFGWAPDGSGIPSQCMQNDLQPCYVTLNDLHDQETRNHHHVDDAYKNYEMAFRGRSSVENEIKRNADFLEGIAQPNTQYLVVESNHDIALNRYILSGRYRGDELNFKYGLKLELEYLNHVEDVSLALDAYKKPESFSLSEFAIREVCAASLRHVHWIHDGESFEIDGIEVGSHGFRGSNGAKGTVSGYARLGKPMTIGDKHSPQIMDDVYVAGVMQLHHGYNKGPSGWAVSTVLQYANGKRTLVTFHGGDYRAKS